MLIARTYTAVNGLNFIQDSDLAFAVIIAVKREGTQYDAYVAGMTPNRSFVHESSSGKIIFPNVFDGGTENEKVYVLFKPVSATPPVTPPGVCVPVSIDAITLPDMVVGVPYSQTFNFTGTAPFTISGVTVPAGLALTNSGNTALLSGTPTTEGLALVEFDVSNCAGSTASFNQAVNVFAAAVNFYVSNISSYGVQINIVDGVSYSIATGSLPATYLTGITGQHGTFSTPIRVNITGLVFPQTLTLSKNGVILETLSPAIDGNYIFASQSFLSTDELVILLN